MNKHYFTNSYINGLIWERHSLSGFLTDLKATNQFPVSDIVAMCLKSALDDLDCAINLMNKVNYNE